MLLGLFSLRDIRVVGWVSDFKFSKLKLIRANFVGTGKLITLSLNGGLKFSDFEFTKFICIYVMVSFADFYIFSR